MKSNDNTVAPLVRITEVAPSMESLHEESPEPDRNIHIDRKFQGRESIISSQISLYIERTKQKIPDGGWGWLVVVASFYINMISDGVGFTFGLLYIEFLSEFGASKSATSWIGSLFMAIPLIAGPLGSALVDKYGCKWMTIIGGLICTIGFILSSYAKSIGVMYVTFGIIGGLGLSLCFITAVVSIAFWFEKRRTFALGLAASGTGLGTVVFSPLSTLLKFEYGWRGTLMVMAGFFANMCVSGMLMRDPDWIIEEEEKKTKKSNKFTPANSKRNSLSIKELKESLKRGGDSQYLLQDVNTSMDPSDKDRFSSAIDLPTFLKENETVPLEVLKQLSENKQLYNIILENYPNLLTYKSISEKGLHKLSDMSPTTAHTSRIPLRLSMKLKKTEERAKGNDTLKVNNDTVKVDNDAIKVNNSTGKVHIDSPKIDSDAEPTTRFPLFRSFSTKSAKNQPHAHSYLRNIRFRKNSMGYRGAMLNIHKYKLKASSCPNVYRNSFTTLLNDEDETWYEEFWEILKGLTHFSLFLELHFLLLSVSTIILFIWFIVPYFYLADHMTQMGYSEAEASFVLSVIGFTNIIGMVLLGWAGDRLNVAKTYAICLILCGLSVGSLMFFTGIYVMLVINGGLFGLFFASCLSLTPSLLAQLVPLDDFTMAYGLFLLCQGIGNLIGPPLAGFIFDLTQSWDQSFYQASAWITFSGILIAVIPFTENRKLWGSGPILSDRISAEEKEKVSV